MMTLKEAKAVIRAFIRANWNDQKLHDVYAFNRDGRMHFTSVCSCIIGVTGASTLHDVCTSAHYHSVKLFTPGAWQAEVGYRVLHHSRFDGVSIEGSWHPKLAQVRLSAMIRAEMRRRDRARAAEQKRQQLADELEAIIAGIRSSAELTTA